MDQLKDQVFRVLLTYMMADPGTIERALGLILISRNLERIADHATNIAEDVIFVVEAKDVRHHHEEREGVESRACCVIEDDPTSPRPSPTSSSKAGLDVKVARTGEEGLECARKGVDLVLLDLNLPGMDGLEVCRMIRRQTGTAHVPIIIVSARADEVDRVLGLEMGADDYVVKPFSLKELAARCRVALRRAEHGTAEGPQGYRDENFEVEFDSFIVRYRGPEIRLTHKEFELFRYMVERAGPRAHPRAPDGARLGLRDGRRRRAAIDAHIRRLRLKLGPARHHVETIVGLGYRFVSTPGQAVSAH